MEVKAIHKHARISPLKARDVVREIQGLPVSQALDVLNFTPRKAAFLIGKTVKSAVANAENNHDLSADALTVKEAVVDDGFRFRRYKPRARGGASLIRRRTSHIRIVLSDGAELKEEKKTVAKKTTKKTASSSKKKASSSPQAKKKKTATKAKPKTAAKNSKEN